MHYILFCEDKPDSEPLRLATRERHLAWAADQADVIHLAGAMLSDDGELLGQVEPKQIKNTYVYEKKGDSWQLTDFRPTI